jgi:hypothetical protein
MNSWTVISRKDPRAENHQILGCIWVYTYKTDKHGRFIKCKARLMIRGDQQTMLHGQETYTAILANRFFRTIITITAHFNLKIIQYDVINAFVHAHLD